MRAGTVGARCGAAAIVSQARSSAPVRSATSKARRNSSGVVAPAASIRAEACSSAPSARSLSIRTCRSSPLPPASTGAVDLGQKDRQEQLAQGRQVVVGVGDQRAPQSRASGRRPKGRAAGPKPQAGSGPPHPATGHPAPWSSPVRAGRRPGSVTGGSSMATATPPFPGPPAWKRTATASRSRDSGPPSWRGHSGPAEIMRAAEASQPSPHSTPQASSLRPAPGVRSPR